MTTLVTGASGFIGRHLVPRIRDVRAERIELMQAVPALPGVETVIHCAAQIDDPRTMRAVNVEGTERLLEWADRSEVRTFVFLSTGGIGAPGLYQATKREAEEIVRRPSRVPNVHIVRLFFPYGRGQDPPRLVPRLIERIRAGHPMIVDREGGPTLSLTHVADAVEAILRIARLPGRHVIEVGGPPAKFRSLASCIGEAVGRPPSFDVRQTLATSYVSDEVPLRALTGFAPATGIEQGIPTCV